MALRNADNICHCGISWQTCVRDNIWHCGIRTTFAFVEYHVRHEGGITFDIALCHVNLKKLHYVATSVRWGSKVWWINTWTNTFLFLFIYLIHICNINTPMLSLIIREILSVNIHWIYRRSKLSVITEYLLNISKLLNLMNITELSVNITS